MTDWTDLSDVEPGDPILASWGNAARDNIKALAEGSSGAPDILISAFELWDVAGNNNYYLSGDLGGDLISITDTSWHSELKIKFFARCQIRFYWGYRNDNDNWWSEFRIEQNGAIIFGPYNDEGTGGADPIHWRTDDITISAGDVIDFQGRNEDNPHPGELYIYMRGERKSAPHIYGLPWDAS